MTDPTITEAEVEAARKAVLVELGQIDRAQPWGITDAEAVAIARAALLAAERVRPNGILGESVDALAAQCEAAEARAEKAEAERNAAKSILSKCADAIGNGAAVSQECSIEFMSCIPREIGLHVASLTEDLGETKEQRDAARAQADALAGALRETRPAFDHSADDWTGYGRHKEILARIDKALAAYDSERAKGEASCPQPNGSPSMTMSPAEKPTSDQRPKPEPCFICEGERKVHAVSDRGDVCRECVKCGALTWDWGLAIRGGDRG